MILTLLFTIVLEAAVVLGYSVWHKKPVTPILITSVIANLITQSFLWVVLTLFFRHYLIALLVAEIIIWLIESYLLYRLPKNLLRFQEAIFLSLSMNLTSLVIGWFLPI
ncbi:MAG TPA: hypothetical protein VJM08_08555 [Anaerolineales bacterium]|nr:hypothetical protein [Anaerolineales bacterium]